VAELASRILDAGAAVVGFDIVFPEPELNPAALVLGALGPEDPASDRLIEVAEQLDGDRIMADRLGGQPVVLGFNFNAEENGVTGAMPAPLLQLPPDQQNRLAGVDAFSSYTGNLPVLQASIPDAGFFAVRPDDDGVIRRAAVLARYENGLYPSLALAMVHSYLGQPGIELQPVELDDRIYIEGVSLGGAMQISCDRSGRVIVPFRGKGSYRYISAGSILRGEFDPAPFRDALVLIGTTAAGLFDLRATPLDSVFPGVEVHANIISAMLDESFPIVAVWAEGLDLTMIFGFGLLFAVLFPFLRAGSLLLLALLVLCGYVGLNLWLWQAKHIVTSLALPLLTLLLLAISNIAWGFYSETTSRTRLKDIFGQYVPKAVAEELNRDPEASLGFDGESREMTVLFADIRGFTTISEGLSAAELKRLLNTFFTPMTKIIFDRTGTIDKYVGDMIMAFWGAPLQDADHRAHGIEAALAMLREMERMQPMLKAEGWPEIRIGIGLNSGYMNVGDMGSIYRRAYTVIGDAVNLGSRLEGLSKFYGVPVVVSEATRQGQEAFLFRALDRVRVKGKLTAVAIFEPICRRGEETPTLTQELAAHEAALAHYYAQRWDEAEAAFRALVVAYPEVPVYAIFLDRVAENRHKALPPDWDGAFTHTSK